MNKVNKFWCPPSKCKLVETPRSFAGIRKPLELSDSMMAEGLSNIPLVNS